MFDISKIPFAHRGVHIDVPENSLASFQRAVDLGVGIELDIHLTKGCELVVFHDYDLRRMTEHSGSIEDLKSGEAKNFYLINSKEKIPLLADVLNLVKGKVPILIELKCKHNYKSMSKELARVLHDYKGQIFIQAFNPVALRYVYKKIKNIPLGLLSSYFDDENPGLVKRLCKTLWLYKFSKANFVSYDIKDLPNQYLDKINCPTISWVITNKQEYEQAKKYSCNIITEYFGFL